MLVFVQLELDISQNKRLEETLLRRLGNCFEAYQQFPIDHRFERFKSKKQYFLEEKSDAEQMKIYHEFVFYHFVLWHHLVPKISKTEILEYYYRRKNE
jgi:hypothetical protein